MTSSDADFEWPLSMDRLRTFDIDIRNFRVEGLAFEIHGPRFAEKGLQTML